MDALDFGLVSFGYRYTKEFILSNICPITMTYEWRVPKDHHEASKKEFTVSDMVSLHNNATCHTIEIGNHVCACH